MLKKSLALVATIAFLGAAACSQGPNEEAGEAADVAAEQSTTGSTDLGQGPMEEAGEHADAMTDGATTAPPAGTTTAPTTTP